MKRINGVCVGSRQTEIYYGAFDGLFVSSVIKHDRVMIVTDSGVPEQHLNTVRAAFSEKKVYFTVIPQGEKNKNFSSVLTVLSAMRDTGFERTDAVIAIGGGMPGDLSGLCASLYMRGISFYYFPSTLLACIDASVGGKTAVNSCGIKNLYGNFYAADAVFICPEFLCTLSSRQFRSGLAEAVKTAALFDENMFRMFEKGDISADLTVSDDKLEYLIINCLDKKICAVEGDEFDRDCRRLLNFGHTAGHAFEGASSGKYLHGECISAGMLVVTEGRVRQRLSGVLSFLGLPLYIPGVTDEAVRLILSDKKNSGGVISAVFLDEIKRPEIRRIPIEDFCERIYRYESEMK